MALSPTLITAQIIAAGSADLQGPTFPTIASAVGIAVYNWVVTPGNLVMVGVTSGLTGTGTINGKVFVVANIPLMVLSLQSAGVAGSTAPLLAKAIAIGISTAFTASAQYSGPSIGVGTGVDNSLVSVSNGPGLVGFLSTSLPNGPSAPLVAAGLGAGIAGMLQTATGVGVVTGVPVSAIPIVGTSITSVF